MRGIQPPAQIRDLQTSSSNIEAVFEHQITVSWGDCDPAQIAYTANIPAWGLLAVEAWYKACLEANWYELNLHYGIGTPFVAMGFQFKSPVTPLELLAIRVFVVKLGNSSVVHRVEGRQAGIVCFTGETTAAFVNATDMKPIPIPENMRQRIQHYLSVQDR